MLPVTHDLSSTLHLSALERPVLDAGMGKLVCYRRLANGSEQSATMVFELRVRVGHYLCLELFSHGID